MNKIIITHAWEEVYKIRQEADLDTSDIDNISHFTNNTVFRYYN